MKIYLVVEGDSDKLIYNKWIKYVNPRFKVYNDFYDFIQSDQADAIYIISGGGYPTYFDVIKDAVFDVSSNHSIDRLVVSIDSEEMDYEDKYNEIESVIDSETHNVEYRIIIQHCCLESWLIGNKYIVKRNTENELVKEFRSIYDVLKQDPEFMPGYKELYRAQFTLKYLRTLLNDKYRNLTYNKNDPKVVLDRKYYSRIERRFKEDNHIKSFSGFLESFI